MASKIYLSLFVLLISTTMAVAQRKEISDSVQIQRLKKDLGVNSNRARKIERALETNRVAIEGIIQRKELTPQQRNLLLHDLVMQRDSVVNAELTTDERNKLKSSVDKSREQMKKDHQMRRHTSSDSTANTSH